MKLFSISRQDAARLSYDEFQPHPKLDNLAREGGFALFAMFCAFLVLVALNKIFAGNGHAALASALSDLLLIYIETWVTLVFLYVIFKIAYGRRKLKLFRVQNPNAAQYL